MELDHSFAVSRGADDVWKALQDIERVAPCLPGATVTAVDGDDITGEVKVKLGPVFLKYAGRARFVERDDARRTMVLEGSGRDARGNGAATARIVAVVQGDDTSSRVSVRTDLDITGKAAQFGRSVIADVSARLMDQFAADLAAELGSELPPAPASVSGAAGGPVSTSRAASAPGTDAASADLLRLVAPVLARRGVPVLMAVVVAVVLRRWWRRG